MVALILLFLTMLLTFNNYVVAEGILPNTEGWIYIGTIKNKNFTYPINYQKVCNGQKNRCEAAKVTSIHDITSIQDIISTKNMIIIIQNGAMINLREDRPRYRISRGWILGKPLGIIKKRRTIEILDVDYSINARGGGKRVWAWVRVLEPVTPQSEGVNK